jgi:hypothetical protein
MGHLVGASCMGHLGFGAYLDWGCITGIIDISL